jgi:hypothetical protein
MKLADLKSKCIYFLGMEYEELRNRIINYGKLSYRNGYRDGYFEGIVTGSVIIICGVLLVKTINHHK